MPGKILAGRTVRQGDQLVGLARHGRDNHSHVFALGGAGRHDLSHIGNAVQIADRCAAEFQYRARHFAPTDYLPRPGRPIFRPSRVKFGADQTGLLNDGENN